MISNKIFLFLLVVAFLAGCGGGGGGGSVTGSSSTGGGSSGTGSGPESGPTVTGNNVLSITVNGSLCSPSTSASYLNKPCVSVTVCNPGDTSTCQTIDDILLDTGSFGLRIFKSALSSAMSFSPIAMGSGSLAECAQFGDGSSTWGPVQVAGVMLASEPTVTVPIQVIDLTFANITTSSTFTCSGAVQSPADAGFNGILGVGVRRQDCGSACANSANTGIYYSCSGSICSGTTVTLPSQVQNPVALLPDDYNGVIVMLPSVPSSGTSSVNGSLVLGIGTQGNNHVPSGVAAYATNGSNEIITKISGSTITYGSVIDTGSNGLFFTPPSASQLPDCASPNASWFCPSSIVNLSAVNAGISGSPTNTVSFQIGNFNSLVNSNNHVFSNIGGNMPITFNTFDWGLPFFFGRNVYVGIENESSINFATGPFFAY